MAEEFSDPGKRKTRDFLEGVKQAIASPATRYDGWLLVKRSDTIDCIAELGLTLDDVRDAVLGLSVADYCGGPLHDRNMPGTCPEICGCSVRSWKVGRFISS